MIHREGFAIIALTLIFIIVLNLAVFFLRASDWILWTVFIFSGLLLFFMLNFFRNPLRSIPHNENHILSPADGTIVALEEVYEEEYFHDKRLQVSIFMSPLNVHVNRYPVSGKISYYKYHPGKYLMAWHPKSSVENERTTICLSPNPSQNAMPAGRQEKAGKQAVLFRQIAGGLARRIVFYGKEGEEAKQGEECGFIKFGSRVDILLPLTAKVKVKLKDRVKGGVSVLAEYTNG